MTRKHTSFKSIKSIALAAFVWLGLVILFGKLDGPAAQLTNLLGTAAKETLELLPSFVPAAWQALQVYAFENQPSSPCPFQMLISFWPVLPIVAGGLVVGSSEG